MSQYYHATDSLLNLDQLASHILGSTRPKPVKPHPNIESRRSLILSFLCVSVFRRLRHNLVQISSKFSALGRWGYHVPFIHIPPRGAGLRYDSHPSLLVLTAEKYCNPFMIRLIGRRSETTRLLCRSSQLRLITECLLDHSPWPQDSSSVVMWLLLAVLLASLHIVHFSLDEITSYCFLYKMRSGFLSSSTSAHSSYPLRGPEITP